MEEDIKILEDLAKILDKTCESGKSETSTSIRNLIKGYRELEKEYERVKAGRNWLSERISAQIATPEIFDKILEENYIPKSKIKEKIEELKREFDFYAGREHFEWQDGEFDGEVCDDIALKIKVLQELMEDK